LRVRKVRQNIGVTGEENQITINMEMGITEARGAEMEDA